MEKSKPSQLGYLMEILGISATELAEYLHIDRTNISKWKNGTRPFLRTSNYYEKVVQYLMQKNESIVGGVLHDFFKSLYQSEVTDDERFIPVCIRRFLSGVEISDTAIRLPDVHNQALYQASFTVLRGVDGRQSAMMKLLTTAEEMTEPCQICIFETDQFEWATKNVHFLTQMVGKMRQLLNKGHTIELLHLQVKYYPAYSVVLRPLNGIAFHENMRQYTMPTFYHEKLAASMYAIRNKYLAVGMGTNASRHDIYTGIYTDRFTIDQNLTLFDNYRGVMKPIFVARKNAQVDRVIDMMSATARNREPLYFAGGILSIMTMSRELFTQVIEHNQLTKEDAHRCEKLYTMLIDFISCPDANIDGGMFFSRYFITEQLAYEQIIQYELSAVASVPILMTHAQYLRHFTDTAKFVETHRHIKIIVRQILGNYEAVTFSWFKKNSFGLGANKIMDGSENKLLYFEDPAFIKTFTNTYDEIYDSTPLEFKEHSYIAEIFRSIANEKQRK